MKSSSNEKKLDPFEKIGKFLFYLSIICSAAAMISFMVAFFVVMWSLISK